ncbi:uncharacterized protein B0T23DRAFT_307894 [Neurospora hispaniola]|uniref:Uncharacterized protein n=1 Tax=Neurospora hispaniola TaxID=588809 RepID=A0AAJ0IEC8_9PEZI|nr:hypothetical protein B0T23DRAFT_307894 [Neurospora hispaniola]
MAPTEKNVEEVLGQIDETKAVLTANPSALAGTKRRRFDDDDDDEGAGTKRLRVGDDVDNGNAIPTSTNINIGRVSDEDLPQPSLSSLAPQTSISGPINPTSRHDGHEANDSEKPLLTLQSSHDLTCRDEDLAGRILWAGPKAVRDLPRGPLDKKKGLPPHPALIMSPKVKEDGTVDFLVLTSFQDNSLLKRFPGNSEEAVKARSYFLPIEGALETEPHPDDPVRNFMVKTTKKPHNQKATSFVNTTHMRNVAFDLLVAYKDGGLFAQDYSIDEASFHKLEEFMTNRPPLEESLIEYMMKDPNSQGGDKKRKRPKKPKTHRAEE